jgi:parallel beta-helix repeat protein
LDALGNGRVLYITGNVSPIIRGLRITGGNATGQGGADRDVGGGVYVITATLTLSDCSLYHNHADSGGGGGIYLTGVSNGSITANTFHGNSADPGSGGALALSGGTITVDSNSFTNNHAGDGGAISLFSSDTVFRHNLVRDNIAEHDGGGLNLSMYGGILDGNVIVANRAHGNGGGIRIFGNNTWTNNVVTDNHAGGSGSALYVQPMGPDLVHTTIARNSGGDGTGIYVTSGPIPGSAHVTLTNTILVSQSMALRVTQGHSATIDGVLWYNTPITVSVDLGGFAMVTNESNGDPAFLADGYHVVAGSAAIDKGKYVAGTVDIDGERRPAGKHADLGADELWYRTDLPLALCESW